jgi:hypothetical protein
MSKTTDIREAVQAELDFDPLVDTADITVKNISRRLADPLSHSEIGVLPGPDPSRGQARHRPGHDLCPVHRGPIARQAVSQAARRRQSRSRRTSRTTISSASAAAASAMIPVGTAGPTDAPRPQAPLPPACAVDSPAATAASPIMALPHLSC